MLLPFAQRSVQPPGKRWRAAAGTLNRFITLYPTRAFAVMAALIVLIAVWVVLTKIRYQLNPDGISYMSVARAYAQFHLKQAINGYWGPVVSWLLVPAFWLQIDPVVWFYVLNTLEAVVIVCVFHVWLKREVAMPAAVRLALELMLLLTLTVYALSVLTPDLLFCLLLLLVVLQLASFLRLPSYRSAGTLGVLAALLFFVKSVGLPLFVVIFTAVCLMLLSKRQSVWKMLLCTWVVFAVLVLPFCAAISVKYKKLTFSTSSAYNLALISPTQARQHPIDQPGIYIPRYPTATSSWDDPSYLPMPAWGPLHSKSDLAYYLKQVWYNITLLWSDLIGFGAVFALGVTALLSWGKKDTPGQYLMPLMVAFGVVLGAIYCLTLVEIRYLWSLPVFAFFGIAVLLSYVYSLKNPHLQRYMGVLLGVLVVTAAYPAVSLLTKPVDSSYYRYALAVQKLVPSSSRIAYDGLSVLEICHWAKLQCVGELPPAQTTASIATLRAQNVHYLLLANPDQTVYTSVVDQYYTPVSSQLGLYELRNNI